MDQKIGCIFPGQGAQYPGMGKDLAQEFQVARSLFEEADDLLQMNLSKLLFGDDLFQLTETRNCQPALFVHSIAVWRVLQTLLPDIQPFFCAGLSLGEYSALHVSGRLSFSETLLLVQKRAQFMHDACEKTQGVMSVIMGLDADVVQNIVAESNLPQDLWAANFNCPKQVVVSGTKKGVQKAEEMAKEKGARRVIALDVHGAFHSGLMQSAENSLLPFVEKVSLIPSSIGFAMNAVGRKVESEDQVKKNLVVQVTHPVLWQECIQTMNQEGVTQFLEIGAGKTLAGMNRKIGVTGSTKSVDQVADLVELEKVGL